jgi:signal transduction histidine kinase
VRTLSQDEAAAGVPVIVDAIVLGVDPGSPWSLFMHDGSSGCYVKLIPGTNTPAFAPGQRLRITGVSMKLGYYPNVGRARFKVMGQGSLPEPVRLSQEQLFSPAFDSTWVEVPAVVVGYDSKDERITLDVKVYGLPFKAELPLEPRAEERVVALVQRPVRLRGVLGTIFNQDRQMTDRHFFVPSLDAVVPAVTAVNGSSAPLIEVTQILTGGYGSDMLVRIKGAITQADPDGFYLRDETGSTFVRASRDDQWRPGTIVEVEGFGDIAPFRPVLRATRVVRVGEGEMPAPVPFAFNSPALPEMHGELITLEAEYIGHRDGRVESILQCQSDHQVFEVLLPAGSGVLPSLNVGDTLAITGVCELTTTHALPRIGWVDGFRVHLASPSGVRVVARAPWWTTRRLVVALAIMSSVAALGLMGTWVLRRQVNRQMGIISENLRAEAVGKERDRMARDLHDTLEQQLSGIALQLDGLDDAIKTNPQSASRLLSLARRMLRFTRIEARRSVWDLRSTTLESEGLGAALQAMAQTATGPAGPVIEVNVSGSERPLPAAVKFHLLRIAQEALANAIKHSEARRVSVDLEWADDLVRLAVSDDGKGFNTQADFAPGPHFGLLGMRERVAKINGRITITTSPGAGCSVSVAVPPSPPVSAS